MGIRVGIPVLKLSRDAKASKHRGDAKKVIYESFGERYSKDKDLDRTKSNLNIYTGFSKGKDLYKYWEEEANTHLDSRGRKLRSDAVIGFSLIIKADYESMQKMSESERIKFLQDSSEIVSDLLHEHGLQVDATALHRDEINEHMHVFGHDEEYRAGKKIDIRLYRDFNSEYPRRMRARGYDVEDMSVYDSDKAKQMSDDERENYKSELIRHKQNKKTALSSNQYKADKIAEQEKALQDRERDLQARENALRASQSVFRQQQEDYKTDIEKERREALESVREQTEQERHRLLEQVKREAEQIKHDRISDLQSAIEDAKSARTLAYVAEDEYNQATSMFREAKDMFVNTLISDLDRYVVQAKVKDEIKQVRAGSYFKNVIKRTFNSFGELNDNRHANMAKRATTSYRNYFDDIEEKMNDTDYEFD